MDKQENELIHDKKKAGNAGLIVKSVLAVLMLGCLTFYLLYDPDSFDIIPKLRPRFKYALPYILLLSVPMIYFVSAAFDLVYVKKNKEKLSAFTIVVFVVSFVVTIALMLALFLQRYFV